ncbi:MAG: formylglycine-generating enzyme family protein [Nitrospirae bacterium]|nr:formylglycine-generating enzyme family protein [Nitrospirota bacterium]
MELEENLEFVLVKGGTYDMGDGDNGAPVHEVTVDDFYMGTYPVTFDQYDLYCDLTDKSKPYDEDRGRGKRPVLHVNWYDVVEFCNWLTKETGRKYRLPSEAEWEYACRSGGKNEKYAGTNDDNKLAEYAWYNDKKLSMPIVKHNKNVGQKKPNGLGLYDMSGNVFEWVLDVYSEDAYNHPAGLNPVYAGENDGLYARKADERVVRDGSWYEDPENLRCTYRMSHISYFGHGVIGFRLVREE